MSRSLGFAPLRRCVKRCSRCARGSLGLGVAVYSEALQQPPTDAPHRDRNEEKLYESKKEDWKEVPVALRRVRHLPLKTNARPVFFLRSPAYGRRQMVGLREKQLDIFYSSVIGSWSSVPGE